MRINYLLIISSALLLGIFFVAVLKKNSLRYNILMPQKIPLIGGIGIFLSFVLVSLFGLRVYCCGISREAIGIVISSSIMLTFGILDDWLELSVGAKFSAQIIATAILIVCGTRTHIVYIWGTANIIVTFIWILGITNAFNHLDVLDGVSGVTAAAVALSFFIISFFDRDTMAAILTLSLTGAVISFLIYNLPPAKIYMGNSGSHFLGFVLAAVAITISYASLERKVALVTPILILGLPIFDSAFLILMRVIKGKLIFKKSNDHLALRFLKMGYSKHKAFLCMLLLALFFSIAGIIVSQVPNLWGMIVILSVISASLIVTVKMGRVVIHG